MCKIDRWICRFYINAHQLCSGYHPCFGHKTLQLETIKGLCCECNAILMMPVVSVWMIYVTFGLTHQGDDAGISCHIQREWPVIIMARWMWPNDVWCIFMKYEPVYFTFASTYLYCFVWTAAMIDDYVCGLIYCDAIHKGLLNLITEYFTRLVTLIIAHNTVLCFVKWL